MAFTTGGFLILLALIDIMDTIVWHYSAADPGWGELYVRVKTAYYSFDLIYDIVVLLVGVIIVIGTFLYRRRHRCSGCRSYVRKDQNYCGNCGKKL